MKIRIFFLFSFLQAGMLIQAQNLSAVGNAATVPAGLSLADLKSRFTGSVQTWSNGTKVVLALMKSTTEAGILTCSKLYGMSCDDVTKYWLKKAMDGSAAPAFFSSVADLQAFIARSPGAIGIIDPSAAIAGVRVITIDGKTSF